MGGSSSETAGRHTTKGAVLASEERETSPFRYLSNSFASDKGRLTGETHMGSHAVSDFTVLLLWEDVKGLQVAVGREGLLVNNI